MLVLGTLVTPGVALAQPCAEPTIDRYLDQMVQWTERTPALKAIEACGSAATPGLITALEEGDRDHRLEALAALEALLSARTEGAIAADRLPDLIDALIHLLQSSQEDVQVRMRSAVALGTLTSYVPAQPYHQEMAAALILALDEAEMAVRTEAAYALGRFGQSDPKIAQAIGQALQTTLADPELETDLRLATARALADLNLAEPLVELLQSSTQSDEVKITVVRGLASVTEPDRDLIAALVALAQADNADLALESTFALSAIAQTSPAIAGALLSDHLDPLAATLERPSQASLTATVEVLAVASDAIAQSNPSQTQRNAAIQSLNQGLSSLQQNPSRTDNLERQLRQAIDALDQGNPTLERVMAEAVRIGGTTLLIHSLFWLALVAIYPTSPQVQAIFFWNPRVRKLFGLGYVELALTWVPWLRAKLFAPFRANLLAEADLGEGIEPVYFAGSDVLRRGDGQRRPLIEAIPEVKGQVVLEGESGLGKTMALKQMVQRSRRLVVYLPARRCAGGVIEAIRDRLHGPIQDGDFLQSLIYSGAIDICIDGLNEVTPDTRAKVSLFAETYFKGNLVITTQPMDWEPPNNATVYVLQPLTSDQIGAFLQSRSSTLPATAPVQGVQYEQACRAFLDQLKPDQLGWEVMAHTLSNPMELTVVAQMIADGKQPDLLNLQQQQYNAMASRYQYINMDQPFPLAAFAEMAYEMRQTDASIIPAESWFKELNCMEDYRMVLSRQLDNAKGGTTTEWRFRHEKIQDFFIVQTFWGQDNERPAMHLGDPRFRGVYFLLATELPLVQAMQLRELLITHAVKTKDHTVSDRFIELLQTRPAA
ncbi:hypothetical protein C7293_07990 [filamentous cyanobacterium CCT1]|nr:hypothetical protein C7293_07990 [filamentous cyanobacterium CCT1]PSN80694.1 hypothetical protein C8B47_05210 [filamentous cyanobacterium CCP4]